MTSKLLHDERLGTRDSRIEMNGGDRREAINIILTGTAEGI